MRMFIENLATLEIEKNCQKNREGILGNLIQTLTSEAIGSTKDRS